MIHKTTLGQVAAKWHPATRLGEFHAVSRLTDAKIRALDLSPSGLQTMIRAAEALLEGEEHLYRRKRITDARKGLTQLASGSPAPDDWHPIWDVFGYWPAAEEIITNRPPPTDEELAWRAMTPIERLKIVADAWGARKPHNTAPDSSLYPPDSSQQAPDTSPDSPETS